MHSKTSAQKQHILQSALRCFIDNGLSNTTIDMIRHASNTSVGSLYHHFGNKDRIAASLYLQGMREFGDKVRHYFNELPASASAEQGIKALVYANVDWINENPDWARFIFQHRESVKAGGKENDLKKDQKIFMQDIMAFFQPKIASGEMKRIPIEVVSVLITGPTHQLARQWLNGVLAQSLKDYRETLADAAWASLRP